MNKLLQSILLAVFLVMSASAGETQLVMRDFPVNGLTKSGFKLYKTGNIKIEALGAGEKSSRIKIRNFQQDKMGMIAYGWIVNAKTREVVWAMSVENTSRKGRAFNRYFEGEITLPAGDYIVYFSTLKQNLYLRDGVLSFGDVLDMIFDGGGWWEEGLDEWYIKIDGINQKLSRSTLSKLHDEYVSDAVLDMSEMGDNQYEEVYFDIKEDADYRVQCIGEGFDGKMYDYGWIYNRDDGGKIWEMKSRNSEYAGGAVKNRIVSTQLTLPTGKYVAVYKTDDNHSVEKWNANPPYNPDLWGLLIFPISKNAKAAFKKVKSEKPEPVISILRVGDDEYRSKIFKVKKKTSVLIEAMGEGSSGKMYDYGWIEDASENVIWEMEYDETDHAGGAHKNRIIKKRLVLEKGVYSLFYKSDDSHSYNDWNSSPPYQPYKWGIALYTDHPENIEPASEKALNKDSKWDYRIVRVGDSEHIFKTFYLKKLTRIDIYALGEGSGNDMDDYGWIKNEDSGEIVWEMLYKNTQWAGGADKNRKLRTTIYLPEGNYTLHYKTDGSHSYEEWNATPPRNKRDYGISIKLEPAQ